MIYECEDKIHSCRINSLCLDLYGNFSCMETDCPNEYYIRENNKWVWLMPGNSNAISFYSTLFNKAQLFGIEAVVWLFVARDSKGDLFLVV